MTTLTAVLLFFFDADGHDQAHCHTCDSAVSNNAHFALFASLLRLAQTVLGCAREDDGGDDANYVADLTGGYVKRSSPGRKVIDQPVLGLPHVNTRAKHSLDTLGLDSSALRNG